MRGMHMNPDFYTDPETFNPERFLHDPRTMTASANGNINNRDHFNFGFGRYIQKRYMPWMTDRLALSFL
jgi:cytochrome P450